MMNLVNKQIKSMENSEISKRQGAVYMNILEWLLIFRLKKEVHTRMDDYIKRLLDDFPRYWRTTDIASSSAANNLFDKGIGKKLDNAKSKQFHTTVAKALCVAKRGRPDILPTVSVLTT